ncbi:MAG TPA: DUF998 domain-containing protein [Acidimicrobiales bacterium]
MGAPGRRTQLLVWGGAAGAVGFVMVFLVDGATRPGYSPARHPVSALSLGSRGWVQVTSFVVTSSRGGGTNGGVVAVHREATPRRVVHRTGPKAAFREIARRDGGAG